MDNIRESGISPNGDIQNKSSKKKRVAKCQVAKFLLGNLTTLTWQLTFH
jgi:hypothetical protein